MTRTRSILACLALALAAVAVLAPSASAAPANCPGTFQVLHNDRIGDMQLPEGPYVITVLDSASMGCTEASQLFSEFLEDWDGNLPRPWVATDSTRTFRAGRGSSVGFRVTPDTNPNPPTPPHPPSDRICPGYFQVLHNDRIGSFSIPKGKYRITLLAYAGVTCQQSVKLFQQFLQDYNGVLQKPWVLDPGTGTFSKGDLHIGFRIKPYVSDPSDNGNRKGTHPVANYTKCKATFNVQNNDRIGALRLAKGNYNVWVRSITCPQSTTLFARFLQLPTGNLPKPWTLNAKTATFTQGRNPNSFRVKPVGR